MDWGKVMEAAQLLAQVAQSNGARATGNVTVGELLDEFHTAKLRAGRSLRYLRQMRVSVSALLGKRKRPLAAVTRQVIENALDTPPLAPRTRRGYLADVRTLLTFAVRREWLPKNPAAFIDAPLVVSGPPGIHTPAQVRAVLEAEHSEQLLFAHYRELVTQDAAREFFSLRPENGQMELPLAA